MSHQSSSFSFSLLACAGYVLVFVLVLVPVGEQGPLSLDYSPELCPVCVLLSLVDLLTLVERIVKKRTFLLNFPSASVSCTWFLSTPWNKTCFAKQYISLTNLIFGGQWLVQGHIKVEKLPKVSGLIPSWSSVLISAQILWISCQQLSLTAHPWMYGLLSLKKILNTTELYFKLFHTLKENVPFEFPAVRIFAEPWTLPALSHILRLLQTM